MRPAHDPFTAPRSNPIGDFLTPDGPQPEVSSTPRSGGAVATPAARFPDVTSASDRWLLAGIVGLAFLVRLVPVLVRGSLYGVQMYDDGVYFGAALAMVQGLVPYRDFLFLHPPGILYLTAPFAALSNALGDPNAFAAARIAFTLLGAINTGLVVILASRMGRRCALLAGLLYAVWPAAVIVERTTWLIGPQITLLLVAMLALKFGGDAGTPAVRSRRALIAGLAMGLAFSTQVWNAVPGAILLVWLLAQSRHGTGARWRPPVAYVLGAATAAALAWTPFLLASGTRILRYVFLDQAGRGATTGSMLKRIRALEGLPIGSSATSWSAVLVVGAFLVVAICVAWATWRRPALRPWAILVAAQLCVIAILPPFLHYAGWAAPVGTAVLATTIDTAWIRRSASPRFRGALVLTSAGAIGVLLLLSSVRHVGHRLDLSRLRDATAAARCVSTDSPVLLIELDRLSRSVREGCPLVLDPTGTSFDLDRSSTADRAHRPEYQAAMAAYYGSGDATLLMRLRTGDGLSAATMASIRDHLPVVTEVGRVTVMTTR